MNSSEIKSLFRSGNFKGQLLKGKLVETHISWVILSGDRAFKIKKPVHLSFVDFSSLEKRRYYCEQEVYLNARFTDIYLGVEPVYFEEGHWSIGGEKGLPRDFAVVMKRMDEDMRMDRLLEKAEVSSEAIEKLAHQVASFHKKARVIHRSFDLQKSKETFNDILSIKKVLEELPNYEELKEQLHRAVRLSDLFLTSNSKLLEKRSTEGFVRDVHGDLHGGNVFLMENPVLFDCIEFKEDFRQIDVLYEVAFLCMDLESWGREDLSRIFLTTYFEQQGETVSEQEEKLFNYYKCLRANIRAKVFAIEISQAREKKDKKLYLNAFNKYFSLFVSYLDQLEG
ncbi:phosphotransferase [Algoriphagus lutimaris]|uniref:phosphotransferase n=1 Tax=Algoriphagus lutimaris TaxID=613197 RepID=UPI00196B853B|nr:phosphotransferase [Algoriphagus lutimaris]MBN3520411.1 phosphotransferase [Algoriphagus lutimaris]